MRPHLLFFALVAGVLSAGCDRSAGPTPSVEFCQLDQHSDGDSIRARAHLVISAHGWFLVDAACPDRTIDWRNTDELRAKEYYHELESVAWATLFDSSGPPQDLLVEFTGVLRWQPQMSRLRVDVHGVDAFAVAAAALPYVDERGDLSAEPPE